MPLTFGVQDRGVQSRRDCINQPRVARNELPWGHEITIPSTLKGLQRARPGLPRLHNWRMPIHRQPLIQPLQGCGLYDEHTQGNWVARSSQPWAECINPFGLVACGISMK